MTKSYEKRDNCINLFRLIAALEVAYGHSIVHMNIQTPNVINSVFGYFQGVPIFFILSGFLIWDSVERSKNYYSYLRKRFWRIYPELWVGVAFESIVLAILYNITNIKPFILFIVTQATCFQFWTPSSLRGYGCGTPNGALWTICVIIQFYVIIWFIRKLLHNTSRLIWGISFSVTIVLGMLPGLLEGRILEILLKLYEQTIFNYLYLFLAGAFLAEYRNKIMKIIIKYWWLFTISAVVFYSVNMDIPFTRYAIIKNVLSVIGIIGFSYAFPKLNIKTDIFYGLYIYHMTIVNAMITLGFTGKIKYMFIALLISIVLAWVSTKTIGALSVKKKAIVARN